MSDLQYTSLHGPLHPSLDPESKAWKVVGKHSSASHQSPKQAPASSFVHNTGVGKDNDHLRRLQVSEWRERPREPDSLGLEKRSCFNAPKRVSSKHRPSPRRLQDQDHPVPGPSTLSAPQIAVTPRLYRLTAGPRRPHKLQPLDPHGVADGSAPAKPEANELEVFWSARVEEFYSSLFQPKEEANDEEPIEDDQTQQQKEKKHRGRRRDGLLKKRNMTTLAGLSAVATNKKDAPLKETFRSVWSKSTSPAWDKRTNSAWGGVGWHCELMSEEAHLKEGWARQAESAAAVFDEQHNKFSSAARHLLKMSEVDQKKLIDKCQLGLHSSKYSVQPLRLGAASSLSPRSSTIAEALIGFKAPLALASNHGGPLVPVFERKFQTEVFEEDEEPEPEDEPEPENWTLYGSIWGPRCEWCHAKDFFDTREVVFERFVNDWAVALRLGLAKVITQCSEGAEDEDGDGVPDEMEDVACVLVERFQLIYLAWINCTQRRPDRASPGPLTCSPFVRCHSCMKTHGSRYCIAVS